MRGERRAAGDPGADDGWKAKQAALALLAARSRSRKELADRLRRKGFGSRAVADAVTGMERLGLLDDRAFAEAWVRDRLRARPRSTRTLLAELAGKGIAPEVARQAAAAVMHAEETDDARLCGRAAEKWLKSNPAGPDADGDARQRRQRRLAGYLTRRGFAAADIAAALRAVPPP